MAAPLLVDGDGPQEHGQPVAFECRVSDDLTIRTRDELGWYVPAENLVGRAEFIFFSHDPSAAGWLEPWKWPQAIRFSRFFQAIH